MEKRVEYQSIFVRSFLIRLHRCVDKLEYYYFCSYVTTVFVFLFFQSIILQWCAKKKSLPDWQKAKTRLW